MSKNNIEVQISESNQVDAKQRKSSARYAAEILEHLELGVPYSCTFIHEIPTEHRTAVEAQLKKSFELWANSWIAPKCRQIIAKTKK